MAYRLLCIYENKSTVTPELRIEVNLIGKSSSLAPFLRKVTVEDLYKEGVDSPELLALINHAGLSTQPFRIPQELLSSGSVRRVLLKQHINYYQPQGKGSVKKITCPFKNSVISNDSIPQGKLLGGELYIDNLQTWHKRIKVRFKYEDTLVDFLPFCTSTPFLTGKKSLFLRDHSAEEKLLKDLETFYDASTGTVSLKDLDISFLASLEEKGWSVYITKPSGQIARSYSHSTPSGIVWFSTEESNIDDSSSAMLEGFLHSRNYQEFNGAITFFRKEDALKTNRQELTKSIAPDLNAQDLYADKQTLNRQEISDIHKTLQQELNAQLRPYQIHGVLWLQLQRKLRHGCLLADEMGLGKTVQVLAHLCCLPNTTKHLVIAPTSLIYNWQDEIKKFTPSLNGRIQLVSYDMLRLHLDSYSHICFDTIIIDEAQIIKNRQTKKYQAVKALQCKHTIILTGTPIENSIEEVWSHFMILMPQMQSLYEHLKDIDNSGSKDAFIALSAKFLKPFILRRDKQSVLIDLPDLTEKTVYIDLSGQERQVYQRVHSVVLKALSTGLSGRISSIALEGLLRLRQCCVSTNLLPKNLSGAHVDISSKMKSALDYIEFFKYEHRKVLVFSQFVSALQELEGALSRADIAYVSLYGDTRDREAIVKRFQESTTITAFLISLKAGGVGLNLTAADRVILLDDWWNPAVEYQALARAHRIGQKNNVLALRLVCKDTVEEKILELQDKKKQTVELFNNTNDKITLDELKSLLE